MSYEERADPISMVAGFDAGDVIYVFVKTGVDGKAELCGANERATGILTSSAEENHAVRVVTGGIAPVEVGAGGLTAGDFVKSAANGLAVTQDSTNPRLGICQASADGSVVAFAEGDIAPILFQPMG